ncbi:hypothetical protein B0H17DRAFT_1152687 [Mycena rosella]|uniref:Uncharacterized protein n=1 Tax=Mycena rosella TaxID=1033263 RepID=A0AAD7BBV0_MYCRO|nr:hypothetical protein B0H17DRAFT_1152687 [Mycena rosella]
MFEETVEISPQAASCWSNPGESIQKIINAEQESDDEEEFEDLDALALVVARPLPTRIQAPTYTVPTYVVLALSRHLTAWRAACDAAKLVVSYNITCHWKSPPSHLYAHAKACFQRCPHGHYCLSAREGVERTWEHFIPPRSVNAEEIERCWVPLNTFDGKKMMPASTRQVIIFLSCPQRVPLIS